MSVCVWVFLKVDNFNNIPSFFYFINENSKDLVNDGHGSQPGSLVSRIL
jgi:hypothetical protein